MQLVVNQLVQSKQDSNKLERIIYIDNGIGCCYLVNINEPSFPYQIKMNDLLEKIDRGDIEIVRADPWNVMVEENELTEIEKQKRDFAWKVILYINHVPDILIPTSRSILIKRAVMEFGISEKTIRHYLKRFWARGLVKNALLPDYANCGKQQKGERVYIKKVGRPPIYPSSIKRTTVSEDWKRIFQISLGKYYFHKSKPSLRHAYQQMLKDYFSLTDNDTNYKVLDLSEPIPTYDQFYYFYKKRYKSDEIIFKREGKRQYLQNHRAITGSATEDAVGVGMYAIDGTINDIYLVSQFDRANVIGRAVTYLTVDIFSRCIVGVYVMIENMSGETLRVALANAFDNKKEFCKRTLDMDIEDNDWPIHYLPHTLLADRGSELISDDLTTLVENLNIKIQNTAPYRPELKGVCETYFQILQNHIKPFLPGSVHKDFNKRGGQDYRKNAVLTLKEYSRILVKCIIYYNNSHYLSNYPLTKDMIEEKVTPVPIEIFKWGLRNGTGQLRTMSSDLIKSIIYPVKKATVTAKGIFLDGLYYSCPTAIKERWFSNARQRGTWKINVHYDPQSMSQIYLRHDRRNYEICTLLNQYEMYRYARIEEIIDLRHEKRREEVIFQVDQLNGQIKLAQDIEQIVNHAKEASKIETKNGDIPRNIKDIRQNRRLEQELMKESNTSVVLSYADAGEEKNAKSDNRVKYIDLFRQKQKEVLNNEDF
ncbi:DDE-type integrase/transposase/recombinase [Bacillus sp. APMAM]|nr:DDE-type integrase/transposase/recombinase [Bacillus sp. APMAM]RTZ54105.1 integrase [Bacillus sp. SAJ1]